MPAPGGLRAPPRKTRPRWRLRGTDAVCGVTWILRTLPAVHGVTGGDTGSPPARVDHFVPRVGLLVELERLEARCAIAVHDQHHRLAGLANLRDLGAELCRVVHRHAIDLFDHVVDLDVLVLGLAVIGHLGHADAGIHLELRPLARGEAAHAHPDVAGVVQIGGRDLVVRQVVVTITWRTTR